MYSAAWHHVHLYSPRSINLDSNMPSYRFLYQTRRISDARSSDALQLTGSDAPPEGWEIVPTYDAKCLVAYMMALNQSHPLKRRQVGRCGGSRVTSGFTFACAWRTTSKMNENTPPPEPPSGQGMDYSEIADVHGMSMLRCSARNASRVWVANRFPSG